MKRILAVLLVLILVSPTVGFACHCCSLKSTPDGFSFERTQHDCCQTVSFTKDNCSNQEIKNLIPNHSQNLISHDFSFLGFSTSNFADSKRLTNKLGPPAFSSQIPLYLANRALRL